MCWKSFKLVLDKQQACVVWTGINKKLPSVCNNKWFCLQPQNHLCTGGICSASKLDMIRKVIEDEDVQFYWIISTADFEINDMVTYDLLLYKIVEIFIFMHICIGLQKPMHGWKNINSLLKRPHSSPKVFIEIFTITLNKCSITQYTTCVCSYIYVTLHDY